jgi:hypothetical protein
MKISQKTVEQLVGLRYKMLRACEIQFIAFFEENKQGCTKKDCQCHTYSKEQIIKALVDDWNDHTQFPLIESFDGLKVIWSAESDKEVYSLMDGFKSEDKVTEVLKTEGAFIDESLASQYRNKKNLIN